MTASVPPALPTTELAAMLAGIDDHLVCYDADWRYVYVNQRAAEMLGRPVEELLGRCIWELFPEAVGNQYWQELHQARAQGITIRSEHWYAPFGRWYRNQIYPTAGGVLVLSTDITAQKQAAVAAEHDRAILQLVADNVPVLISYVDRDCRYRFVNRAYEAWFGRPAARIVGERVEDMVGAQAWVAVRPHVESALAGHKAAFELDLQLPGQPPRCVDVVYVPRFAPGPAAEVLGFAVLVNDISARKAAEQALRWQAETRRLLLALQDLARDQPDAAAVLHETVHLIGPFFGVTRCSYGEVDDQQEYLLVSGGYRQDVPSVAGRHRLADFGPELQAQLAAGQTVVVTDVGADPRTAAPAIQSTYAGMQARAMVCVPLLRQGRFVALLAMLQREPRAWSAAEVALLEQIAERTWFAVANARAEARLRESRDVLALAMRGGRMGVWSRDLRSDVVWWSPELEELFGLAPGSFAGTHASYYEFLHEDDRAAVAAAVQQALAARTDYAIEFRFRHASGAWRWMEGRGRAVYQGDAALMLYGIGMDISERKAAEAELRQLNARLSETDRRRNEFLATLAHELRNPLAPIGHASAILQQKQLEDPDLLRIRVIVDRQLRHMKRLVDDLLDASRVARGTVQLRCRPLDLVQLVRDTLESLQPLLRDPGHDFVARLPEAALALDADPDRLTQVVSNLLHNAVKFTPAGGRIELLLHRAGDQAVLEIADAGVGIDPRHQPHVFEMFSQFTPALERAQGGLGIGLALVHSLVGLHGGSVAVQSSGLGQGTRFVVRLPLAAAAPAPAIATAPAPAAVAAAGLRVLVIDDNQDAAASLAMLLGLGGHQVQVGHDGPDAVRLDAEFQPQLILLDIGLPTLNGYEAARLIRAQGVGRRPPLLVALTGWGQAEDRQRSQQAGFDLHLVKPIAMEALQEVVAQARQRSA